MPDVEESCPADKLRAFQGTNPNFHTIAYINCRAEVKALSDVICTSGNAVKIVRAAPPNRDLLFVPDENLGAWVMEQTGRPMTLWRGNCYVHVEWTHAAVCRIRTEHPGAPLVVHESTRILRLLELFRESKVHFAVIADGSGVFESSQHPIIVGQAAYNSGYGSSFAASGNFNQPGSTSPQCDGYLRINDYSVFGFNTLLEQNTKMTLPVPPKAFHDEMNSTAFDEFGRMQANLGVEAQPPVPGAQNVVLYPYTNPATELIDATNLPKNVVYDANGQPVTDFKIEPISSTADGTQIWRVTHNGVDTHPIHFHLYDVQLINRVTWDNIIIPPDATELGWKDTVVSF